MKTEESLRIELAQVKKYINMKELMMLTSYSKTSLRRKISEGKLKPIQDVPNGKLLFKSSDVKRWIEGGVSFYDNLLINELDLSVRGYHMLQYHNINTIGQVRNFTEENLLKFKHINTKTVSEIKEKLVGFNLSLKA